MRRVAVSRWSLSRILAPSRRATLSRATLFLATLLAGIGPWNPAAAQSSGSGLLPTNVARQFGLERAWFTHVDVGRGVGRVNQVTTNVNTANIHTFAEVTQGSSRWLFSEKDRDSFGQLLGIEGAKKKAQEQIANLKRLFPKAAEATMLVRSVPEVTLYATTDQAIVHAIDGETGKTRWVTRCGDSRHPTTAAAANNEYVVVCNGSNLFVLQAADGKLKWQRQVFGAPGAGPAISNEFVFVPMADGAIESYTLADSKEKPWIYKSTGRALVRPGVGFEALGWPTDRGHFYVASASARSIRYRLELNEQIESSPAFAPPDKLLVTTTRGYVYCLNPLRQYDNIVWRFSSGESMSQSPVVVDDAVYAVTDNGQMLSLDLNSSVGGVLKWQATGVTRFLAASEKKLYVVGSVGRILVLDRTSGGRLGTIPLDEFDLQITNPMTDRMYFGTRTGAIQCVREMGRQWPMLHGDLINAAKTTAPKPKVIQQGLPADDGKPAAPPTDDPFAPAAPKPAGGEDDPFAAPPGGGGGGGQMPAAKPSDDPFG